MPERFISEFITNYTTEEGGDWIAITPIAVPLNSELVKALKEAKLIPYIIQDSVYTRVYKEVLLFGRLKLHSFLTNFARRWDAEGGWDNTYGNINNDQV